MKQQIKNEPKDGITMPDVKALLVPAKHETKTAKPAVTIEDRIMRVEELKSLTTKRQKTLSTQHQLRTFNFAADDSCHLSIMDSQGQKFTTGNSTLISLVKNYLEATLNDKVSALDEEILAFNI